MVILHSSQPNSKIRYASISDSSKSGKLRTPQCFFLNHCCKHSNCEMPCHKYVLWNQMNRCEVVSCRNNIVWIINIVVLLTISLSYFGNLTFQSFSCHKTILVSFSKKLRLFPQISRHNLTAIIANKKKTAIPSDLRNSIVYPQFYA